MDKGKVLRVPKKNINDRKFIKSIGSAVMKMQFDAEKMSIKDRDNHIINKLSNMEKGGILKNNKKIKIHVKNNHWAPGIFPTDAEGEKNFTITKVDFEKTLEKEPEIKDKIEVFIDWDEENFSSSMSNSDILVAWNFPTSNLKKIAPNLKWIHCIAAGIKPLLPLDWMYENLVLTNNSGVHSKKAGEYGLMSVLMLQNYMPKIITNKKNKKFVSLFSNPIGEKQLL
ncbi:MAG: hypothetical protein Ct9H300mP5_5520 [Candidatus Pelagibacterales bacterium]|nr:MAG: hypothetical protein Ct9H300mP5_5520 [Pelagibacterales bacterium]